MRLRIFLPALLVASVLFSGCALHYDVSTYNGNTVRATTKPKLDEIGRDYVFKDGLGQEVRINRLRVRKIEAVNRGDPPSKAFD
jgi:hypothetical protein